MNNQSQTLVDYMAECCSNYADVCKQRDELVAAARLVESRSYENSDGSYTVDASAMDAICKAIF